MNELPICVCDDNRDMGHGRPIRARIIEISSPRTTVTVAESSRLHASIEISDGDRSPVGPSTLTLILTSEIAAKLIAALTDSLRKDHPWLP